MQTIFRLTLFFAAVAMLFGEECGLAITLTDRFGTALPFSVTVFARTPNGPNLANRFKAGVLSGITRGTYGYEIQDDRQPSKLKGHVLVTQKSQVLALATEGQIIRGLDGGVYIADGGEKRPFLTGRLDSSSGARPGRSAWLRFIALFGADSHSVGLDSDLSFILNGRLRGRYFVLLLDGERVVPLGEFRVEGQALAEPLILRIPTSK